MIYSLYTGDLQQLSSVSTIETQTEQVTGTAAQVKAYVVPSPGYVDFNILVNNNGVKKIYTPSFFIADEPTIESLSVLPTSISGSVEPEPTTGQISWTLESVETTPEQKEVEIIFDASIISITNIVQSGGLGTADYAIAGANEPAEGIVTVRSTYNNNFFQDIPVTKFEYEFSEPSEEETFNTE